MTSSDITSTDATASTDITVSTDTTASADITTRTRRRSPGESLGTALVSARARHDQLRSWRHHLHRHPETAFEEHETAAWAATVLEGLGFEVVRGVGGTGVVASLTRGGSGPGAPGPVVAGRGLRESSGAAGSSRAVGLRTDLDGLPIQEVDGREHGSVNPGVMHACGHDGHLAMVLGAAAVLAEEGGFDGTVRILLQPAEEPGRGARAMVDDGLFERFPLDALYGLHNLPGLPAGHLHVRPGPIMASEDNFEITIIGRGGHAARPEAVVDPLLAGAELVLALQSVVARNVPPVRPAVLSCTDLRTDGARNAIPSTVTISGDTRSFDPEVSELLERRIRELGEHVAAAHGATCEVTYTREFAPTVNDPGRTQVALAAAERALGAGAVVGECDPIMPSEDFGVFADQVPACFAFLGNGVEEGRGGTPLHSSGYDLNDEILPAGVAFYVEVVRAELAH